MRVVLLAGALVWAAPMPGVADSATCSYNAGSRTVTVNVTSSNDFAPSLLRDAPGNILISDADGPVPPCGGTVNNTDTIVINNTGSQPLVYPFYINFRSPFVPGFTPEPGSSDEIEFEVNFGPGGRLGLDVRFSTTDIGSPMNVTLGGNQVNLNAGEADGIDADITMTGVTGVYLSRGGHDNIILGSGGAGTPTEPIGIPMEVTGNLGGNDLIVGGSAADHIFGLAGGDVIDGGGGNDSITGDDLGGGTGNDIISGGDGNDSISGGPGNDVILGGPGDDSFSGGVGDDTLDGQGGRDSESGDEGLDLVIGGPGADYSLRGGPDNDTIRGKGGKDFLRGQGGNDHLNGGPQYDVCKGGLGADTFNSCEVTNQ